MVTWQRSSLTRVVCCSVQKQVKYVESGLKAVKARNEYLLCLEAANAALQKYFSEDISELVTVRCHYYFTFRSDGESCNESRVSQ